jgi:proline iminopeptidase
LTIPNGSGRWCALPVWVAMSFIAASHDIRPDWPLRQLAKLVPSGSFQAVHGVDHNFWATAPDRWIQVVTEGCRSAT